MDALLASIIGGGPANVDVTVNGKPLSSLITELASALKNHQDQINDLREYTYKTDEQMWDRISSLEDGVSKINKDLGFEERGPEATAAKSTHQAIKTLEANVTTLDSKRKGAAAATALDHNNMKLLRSRFHTWLNLRNRNHRLRELMSHNGIMIRKRYYQKLQAAVKMFKRRRALIKGSEVLQRFNDNRLAHRYFGLWENYRETSLKIRAERHVALVRAVDAMASVSLRGFLRRKWLQWLQVVAKKRLREDQQRAALRMAAVTSRSLVRRYFSMWVNLEGEHNLRRRQIRTATALAVQSARILAGNAFSRWVEAGRRKKQRRMGAALVPRMAHDVSIRLASRYYLKLWRYLVSQKDSRSRGQLEEMTRQLQKRFDDLSGEVATTTNQTKATVTQLQRLSQQQQDLEKKASQQQQQQTRNPTPPGLRRSNSLSNNNNHNNNVSSDHHQQYQTASGLPSLRQQQQQQPTTSSSNNQNQPYLPPQSGVKDPSSSAMQLGSNVSQLNLRGGGSGELSRVSVVQQPTRSTSSVGGGQHRQQQQQQQPAVPQQWLESPQAAWEQIRSRLEKK